jgi:hypothetical protein
MVDEDEKPLDLILWLRDQIRREIQLTRSVLASNPRFHHRLLQAILSGSTGRRALLRQHERAEERLRTLLMLRQLLSEHPHDFLGCTTCRFRKRLNSEYCATVRLLGGLFARRQGYREEWAAEVSRIMNSPSPAGGPGAVASRP